MTHSPARSRLDGTRVTSEEQVGNGRGARARIPRGTHATFRAPADRDPLGILDRQHAERIPHLVPLRLQRMLESPFAFYRGTAAIQAADMAGEATTGAGVVICGDAHIANFGLYASPQRTMVFDLNDFDEATFGPWEWDLKRMATSVVIAARHKEIGASAARRAAVASVRAYRDMLRSALELDALARFYLTAQVREGASGFGRATRSAIEETLVAANKRTSARVIEKITETGPNGNRRIVENPPTLTHIDRDYEERIAEAFGEYRRTVPSHVSLLLSQYEITDVVRRVVGVGSVGTRCSIAVLTGPRGEPLVLQLKEATESVVHRFGGVAREAAPGVDPATLRRDHGSRVVSNQRILQAVSDPFLGFVSVDGADFYVRQFRDLNASFDIDGLESKPFDDYVAACGSLLARAHAQSPNAAFISGYIGSSGTFIEAVVDWAFSYADQSLADFEELGEAVRSGRYEVAG